MNIVIGVHIVFIEDYIVLNSDRSLLWPVYSVAFQLQIIANKSTDFGVRIELSSLEVFDVCCSTKLLYSCKVRLFLVPHLIGGFSGIGTSGSPVLDPHCMLHHLFPQESW